LVVRRDLPSFFRGYGSLLRYVHTKSPCLFCLLGRRIKFVNIEFDDAKSRRNARERGLPFERAAEFEWESGKDHQFPKGEQAGGESI